MQLAKLQPGTGEGMLILSNSDVARVLTMGDTLEALEQVYEDIAVGDAAGMGREDLYLPSGQPAPAASYYRWAIMAGGSTRNRYVCARMQSDMVSWPQEHGHKREEKYARTPGTLCRLMFLFSAEDGVPLAIINDGVVGHFRVGACAGLGVKYLSRTSSRTVGMIGSGGMARTYLDAFCRVREVAAVKVYSPNAENARLYAEEMTEAHDIEVVPASSAREEVEGADIVSCCTSSIEPVFFGDWLEPGMHVTDVSPDEVELGLGQMVDVAARAGDYTPAIERTSSDIFYAAHGFLGYVAGDEAEKALVPRRTLPEEITKMPRLADLLSGAASGRASDQQTSYFFNLGAIGQQFAAVAAVAYERALDAGLGNEIPADWLLQDGRVLQPLAGGEAGRGAAG
jgi:alanine dehydrogenase